MCVYVYMSIRVLREMDYNALKELLPEFENVTFNDIRV